MDQALREQTDYHVRHYGQTVIFVGDADPVFAYTIGNHPTGNLPELLIIGANPVASTRLLNMLCGCQRTLGKALLGIVDLGGLWPVRLIDVTRGPAKTQFTVLAGEYLGTQDYGVTQVLCPDTNGVFPDDPACLPPWDEQTVLRAN